MKHLNIETVAPERPPIASAGIEQQRRMSQETTSPLRVPSKTRTPPTTGEKSPSREEKIIAFRNGEAVHRHPALRDLLKDGWSVTSAVPHLSESEEVKLLVVLERGG